MALEEDLAELDTVLGDLDSMMKDINIQSVLEFFPNNNNEKFKDIIHSEMDADGPAGRLLRTLSKDGSKRSTGFLTSASSATKLIDNKSTSSSSLYQSDESSRAENSGANRVSSITSSSISYDENMVDLGSCSEGGSHTRPNSICKIRSDSSSENDFDADDFMKCDHEHQNGNINSKLHITVYFQERPIDLEIPSCATAREVAFRIMIVSRLQDSSNWTIFECLKNYELERNLEDHEIVADVIKSWQNQSEHRLQLKNFTKKYEFFEKPSMYVPSYLMENEETTKTATLRADDSWKPEYNSYLTTVERIPELENFLHLKDFRKKSWNRKYCLLRPNGIFSSSKTGLKRMSREVKCKIDFNTSELYLTSSNFKETHKSPNGYCFCFVPNTFANQKGIKCFCAENEQVMLSWIMGYRLAKFGSKLYRNYKIATQDKRAARTVSAPVEMEGVVRRKRPSVEYRVPIDFSGHESRVVSDPDAAKALRNSISSKLPKRIKRRSTGSFHSPYTSGIPALIEKPWFHGKLEREEAVKLLRSNGMEEGLFLVRESCTSTGVNVISVIKKKKILHHQIFKAIGEGQIFYGLEHGPRFQSLEQLIEFYQNYRHAGKSSLLRKPCKRSEKFNY